MAKQRLILMVGLPRSGKTTRALQLARQYAAPIISPDAIRLAVHGQPYERWTEPLVWYLAKTWVRASYIAGHETVIVDACNNTRKRRDDWRELDIPLSFWVCSSTAKQCRARVPDSESNLLAAVNRMALVQELPVSGEGEFLSDPANTGAAGHLDFV